MNDVPVLKEIKKFLDNVFPDDKEPLEEELDYDVSAIDMYHALFIAKNEMENFGI